jgi:predicted dehydrogenase
MNLAFFGVGPAAQPYLGALARRADITVTAVCDPLRRAAEQVAAGWGARVFASHDALLDEGRPEAIWICVPPRLQTPAVRRAAELRVPFFVVPPGAVDFPSAQECGRLVREAKLVTAVGFPTRHTDVVQEAREYVGANPVPLALGWWLRPPEERDESSPAALDLLWSDGCRLLDALRFFCGEVTRVHAVTPVHSPGGLVLQLQFTGGGVGVVTCASYPRPQPRVQLELLGDGWSLEFGDAEQPLAPLRLIERDRTTILRCLNNPAADQAAGFLDAIKANNPAAVPCNYAEALAALAICHAAAVSAKEGRAMDVAVEG